jgi:hypothetical protein
MARNVFTLFDGFGLGARASRALPAAALVIPVFRTETLRAPVRSAP